MQIERHLKVPTGDILVVKGSKGSLEMLSIGDYGKDVNIKEEARGQSRRYESGMSKMRGAWERGKSLRRMAVSRAKAAEQDRDRLKAEVEQVEGVEELYSKAQGEAVAVKVCRKVYNEASEPSPCENCPALDSINQQCGDCVHRTRNKASDE